MIEIINQGEVKVYDTFKGVITNSPGLGAITPRNKMPQDIVGATQITSVSDLRNRRYYFTTMRNREVRMVDLQAIDFAKVREQIIDGDEGRINPVRTLHVGP